jgi:hypothetical protein
MSQKSKKNSNYETLALVLLVTGLTEFFLFFWQVIYLPTNLLGYLKLAFAIFDFYLAYAFFQNKPKIKRTFFFRLFLGLIGGLLVFYLVDAQYGLIWAKIAPLLCLSLLALDRLKKAAILAILAVIMLLTDGYLTAYHISYKQQLLIKLKKYGKKEFISPTFNYKLNTPANWKMVKRDDFSKIKEKFLETEAEIALIANGGQSFCLIIPNKLDKFIRNYSLDKIKKTLAGSLAMKKTVKINKVAPFISSQKGFQIQYTDIIEGVRQDYLIIYLNMADFDLKLIGWTLGNNQEKIYAEIKNIAKNITLYEK